MESKTNLVNKIKVFVIDDHKVIISGVEAMLVGQDGFEIIGYANSGKEAIEKLNELSQHGSFPDVILMDIKLPDISGIELTKQLHALFKDKEQINILAFTMFDEDEYVLMMLKAGAKGYLLKTTSGEELILGLKKVSHGKAYFSDEVTEAVISRYALGTTSPRQNVQPSDTKKRLTKRELEILKLIASALTSKEISKKLNISERTVLTHRRSLMQKLGVKNIAGLIRYAYSMNLVSPPSSQESGGMG
jgi:DNA-binding NarL/FixJ family response regulator